MRLQPRRVSTGGHRPKTQITGANSPNEVFGPSLNELAQETPMSGCFRFAGPAYLEHATSQMKRTRPQGSGNGRPVDSQANGRTR